MSKCVNLYLYLNIIKKIVWIIFKHKEFLQSSTPSVHFRRFTLQRSLRRPSTRRPAPVVSLARWRTTLKRPSMGLQLLQEEVIIGSVTFLWTLLSVRWSVGWSVDQLVGQPLRTMRPSITKEVESTFDINKSPSLYSKHWKYVQNKNCCCRH